MPNLLYLLNVVRRISPTIEVERGEVGAAEIRVCVPGERAADVYA